MKQFLVLALIAAVASALPHNKREVKDEELSERFNTRPAVYPSNNIRPAVYPPNNIRPAVYPPNNIRPYANGEYQANHGAKPYVRPQTVYPQYGNGPPYTGYQPAYGYQQGSGFGGANVDFQNVGPLGRPALSYQAPGVSINLREKPKRDAEPEPEEE